MLNFQLSLLITGSLLQLSVFFYSGNGKTKILALFLGSFLIACFFSLLDPYLRVWDEQFHALVAKSMIENPFKPLLYKDPIIPYNYKIWISNHVWLHKQPLFLWQMALSIKIFGCNEFAVRLPSILMHSGVVLMLYRIGKIAYHERAGVLAAILFSFAEYPLELVAGAHSTEHNDIAFMFYVTASLWAMFEYKRSGNRKWMYLVGLLSGMSILVKWLVGLIVYLVWIILICFDKPSERRKEITRFAIALCITILVALPWQLYTFVKYPLESRYELKENALHFNTVIENQAGGFSFHWKALNDIYGRGDLVPYLIALSIVSCLFLVKTRTSRIIILVPILAVYVFYSIAATKMTSYTLVCLPMIFLCLGISLHSVLDLAMTRIKNGLMQKLLCFGVVSAISIVLLNIPGIQREHLLLQTAEQLRMNKESPFLLERSVINNLTKVLGNRKYVIFNTGVTTFGCISFMFYSDYTAYDCIPNEQQCELATSKGYKIAIFNSKNLPYYIENNTAILKLDLNELKKIESHVPSGNKL
jgi:4-amino-4-deoxy-L-arabinose transferase-like glycosyltransferase